MSGNGNCFDTAMVETFFKTIRSELVWRTIFYTVPKPGQAIARYIDGFYNPSGAIPRSTISAPRKSNEPHPAERIELPRSPSQPDRYAPPERRSTRGQEMT